MAKNTTEAEVIVTLNGTQAKKAVADLTQEYQRLQKEANEAYKAGNDALGKKLDADAKKLMKDVEITRREAKKFADVMKNINGASLKELRSAAKQLQSEINKLTPGTKAFVDKAKQLQQVNSRIRQLTNSFKGLVEEEKAATFSLKGLADGFNKYFGMATAGIAAVTGLSMAFRQCAESAAQLDDTYSDVMKTTGLTHDEVAELDKELMKIDTRTSREQLLLLARDAGKLGISGKEDILGFVRAADQIQVALGEDLGEGAIRNLGKIADVLGLTQSMGIEKSLLSIASAVNAVGQASTASEGYLVDFTQRLAGVAAQTGISASNIIGFASGLDQSAMKVEMASTAFQKFLMKLYEDPAKFAAYANLEVGKFTELLQNDANQAVITILKALKDQDGFASLVPIFKDMGLDGARAVSVLAAMATNINAVTEAQALANVEFEKATSVTEEYNTKNNNMQAQLEKARKEFQNASIALGQSLNPIMLKSTKITTHLIKALAEYGKEIKTVLIVMVALTAALKAKVIWMKLVATWNATLRTGSLALAAAQALLAGNVTRAAAAWRLMNTAMKASVIGVVTAAIAGLIIMIQKLNKETKQLTELQKFEKQLTEDVAKATSNEASRVKALKAIVEDTNQAYQERKLALQELKRIVPEYHADLTEEGTLINNNTEALNNYINTMLQVAKTQVLQDKLRENANKQLEQEQYLTENAAAEFRDELGNWRRSYTEAGPTRNDGTSGIITHMISQDCEAAIDRLEEFKKEEELILNMIRQAGENGIAALIEESGGTGGDGSKNNVITEEQFKYLQERYDKLTKKEKAMVEKQYADLSVEESKALKARYDKLVKADENAQKKAFDARIKEIEANQRNEENVLKRMLINKEISQAEYNAKMNLLVMQGLQQRIETAKKYGQDETKYMSQLLDEELKLIGDGMEEIQESTTKAAAPGQTEAEKNHKEFWEKIYKKRDDIVAGLQNTTLKSEYDTEMAWIEKLHEKKLLSDEEYEKAKLKLKMDYAAKGAQVVSQYAEMATNFVTTLKDYESAKLEAEYQKQLTAAGDNAEQREAIEAEYEQKKLELEKKYADWEMGVKIAKAVAAGAVAAVEAYASAGNPVLGAVMAAIIAATTAMEVATIVQQRNAIKNSSVNSSGSSSSSSLNTGTRTITDGYAEGGMTEGHTTLTTVGERGPEYVIPNWMVRREPVMIANLERYRRTGSHGRSGSIRRGFAEGGYTDPSITSGIGSGGSMADMEQAVENAINRSLANGHIRAFVVLQDINDTENQLKRFKSQTTRA